MRSPRWGLTAVGMSLGFMGGPIGLAIGGSLGGALDWGRHRYRKSHPLDTESVRAVRRGAPQLKHEHIQSRAASAAFGRNKAAKHLHKYLQHHVKGRASGDAFWKSAKTGLLVTAFQRAYNADVELNRNLGALPITGIFDPKTAAALTLYAHQPFSADPNWRRA